MNKIIKKKILNHSTILFEIENSLIAKKAKAGQFIILRGYENSERIPFTICDIDETKGSITIIFQIVGASTYLLKNLNEGDYIHDLVGPLGNSTKIEGEKVCVIGGGLGVAIAYPITKAFYKKNINVTQIIGFRNKDLVILENEFKKYSNDLIICSDDGSIGKKGVVTSPLDELLKSGAVFDKIIAIGPLVMMKYVVLTCKKYNVKECIVSLNPIMIDGTGMCGCCRVSIGGITKFACIDGPEFNGYEVDFDEIISRTKQYQEYERKIYDEVKCNLFKKELNNEK